MIRRILGSLLLVFFSFTLAIVQQGLPNDQRPLAFTHVTVIDATGAPAQPDMTVIISGNRITAIGKSAQVVVPHNALVTNAQGKFMIPGLRRVSTSLRPVVMEFSEHFHLR